MYKNKQIFFLFLQTKPFFCYRFCNTTENKLTIMLSDLYPSKLLSKWLEKKPSRNIYVFTCVQRFCPPPTENEQKYFIGRNQ